MASQGAGRRWPWSRLLLLASFILQSCDHAQQRADDELANRIDQAPRFEKVICGAVDKTGAVIHLKGTEFPRLTGKLNVVRHRF